MYLEEISFFYISLLDLIMKCLKCAFFLIASLLNLSLCVMILILQLTYVPYVTFDVKYLNILVV